MKYLIILIKRILLIDFILFKARKLETEVSCNCFIFKNKVNVSGTGNRLLIGKSCKLKKCSFHIYGKHNIIAIGDNCKLEGVDLWIEDDRNVISIGNNTTIECDTKLAACEGSSISIGEDCMFSHSILIRTTDSHSIVDVNGKRLNRAADITIGNHVWLGLQTLVLKGSTISDNVVVGARSTITSKVINVPGDCVVGAPAKVVKKSINWSRLRIE